MTRAALRRLWSAADVRPSHVQTLQRDIVVAAPLDDTFAFFADAANLERLTPSWLNFQILTAPPIVMRTGLDIDYRIRLYGLAIPWRSRIEVWEPRARFVDRQLAGPYRWWWHEHLFEPHPQGTRVIDRVDYVPRAAWVSGRLVRRDLERIFSHRHEILREIFQSTLPVEAK
jgi:ligand-binding SRPBCC domain-containing protein